MIASLLNSSFVEGIVTTLIVEALLGLVIGLPAYVFVKLKRRGKLYPINDISWHDEKGILESNLEIEIITDSPFGSELHGNSMIWLHGRYFDTDEGKILRKPEIRKAVASIRNVQEWMGITIVCHTCIGQNRYGEPATYTMAGVRVCAQGIPSKWHRFKNFITGSDRMELEHEMGLDGEPD